MSAVPIDATTGSIPSWRRAITSVFPSTTTARSCFAIAAAGEVEPVEDGALLEAVALGRVHVLGLQRIVLAQPARLEAEHAPAGVGEREDDALREVVVAAAVDEPGGEQLVAGELALMRLLRQRLRARREAEPERAADLLAEPSPGEVRPRVLGAGRLPQAALVERRGRREQLAEPVAPLAARPRTRGDVSSYSSSTGSGRRAIRRRRRSRGSPSP